MTRIDYKILNPFSESMGNFMARRPTTAAVSIMAGTLVMALGLTGLIKIIGLESSSNPTETFQKYDNNPKDGYLDSKEFEQFSRDYKLKKR